MIEMDLTLIVAIICGFLFPTYVLLTGRRTIKTLEAHPEKLTLVYIETTILLLVMTVLVSISIAIDNVQLRIIGLQFIDKPMWVLSLVIASAISYWLIEKMPIPESKFESIGKGLEGVHHILPKNQKEYQWAITTSFVAGVCEEIIFRGYLFWQLSQMIHELVAIVIVNLLFGIAHATSKLNNAIKAFGLGLVFSILYYATGSLWLSILSHIIIDLYAATVSLKYAEWKAWQ